MLVRSDRPLDLEMPLSGFSDYITPVCVFICRNRRTALLMPVCGGLPKASDDNENK
jgi:hypothetical protein